MHTHVTTRELVSAPFFSFLFFPPHIHTTLKKTSDTTNGLLHHFLTLYHRKQHPVEHYFYVKNSLDILNKRKKYITSKSFISKAKQEQREIPANCKRNSCRGFFWLMCCKLVSCFWTVLSNYLWFLGIKKKKRNLNALLSVASISRQNINAWYWLPAWV